MIRDTKDLVGRVPSLASMPSVANDAFMNYYNKAESRGNTDSACLKIAWGVVKSKFEKQGGSWVARAGAFKETTFFTFKAEKAEEFVSRTEGGDTIHNYVLTDDLPDSFGTSPTVELMNEWAGWINENNPQVDVDHELFHDVQENYKGDVSLISRAMKFKKGIAKVVNAVVKAGKLVVSILFDKRYENHVSKVRGLSFEAFVDQDVSTKKFVKGRGEFFGLTFAMNKRLGNSRAVRVIS